MAEKAEAGIEQAIALFERGAKTAAGVGERLRESKDGREPCTCSCHGTGKKPLDPEPEEFREPPVDLYHELPNNGNGDPDPSPQGEPEADPLDGLDWTERGALVLAVDTTIASVVAGDDSLSSEMHAALLRLAEKLPRLNEAALAATQPYPTFQEDLQGFQGEGGGDVRKALEVLALGWYDDGLLPEDLTTDTLEGEGLIASGADMTGEVTTHATKEGEARWPDEFPPGTIAAPASSEGQSDG